MVILVRSASVPLYALLLASCDPGTAPAPSDVVPSAPPVPSATASVECGDPPEPPPQVLLYSFSTRYKADPKHEDRAANVELLADRLDMVPVGPGQEWSFNAWAGPRTKENGFRDAPTYLLGEVRPGVGGGTCQVSSTLYAALLHAGIEVLERRPHSRASSYIGTGLDAVVNFPEECWGKAGDPEDRGDPRICYDLRFKNQYGGPIFIRMETSEELDADGKKTLTASILGHEDLAERVPEVKTRWVTYEALPFEVRYRRIRYWDDDRKRLMQSGRPGLRGTRLLDVKWPDGRTEKRSVYSEYRPVHEVWHVGTEFETPEE